MNRTVYKELKSWKESGARKVLMIRGARQVGKTWLVRQLGKEFPDYLEVNLDLDPQAREIFAISQEPKRICQLLEAYYGRPVKPGETLLFLDEIQGSVPAIRSLRYFYEQLPDLHVIAAGSLLELALSEIPSFGVGRIRQLHMYPMSFNEYLEAIGFTGLIEAKREATPEKPLPEMLHARLLEHLRNFMIIGGMPEAVGRFVETGSFQECTQIHNDLILSIENDFARYKKQAPVLVLREVFRSVVNQCGSKFVYTRAGQSMAIRKVQESLELLRMARLVFPVYQSPASGIPVGAGVNHARFKVLLMDTGLQLNLSGLKIAEFLLGDQNELVNRGAMAELFTGLELIKYQSPYDPPDLYYWHREARNSSAEVDFIIQQGRNILPIEVKSGSSGKMQSLFLFLREKGFNRGIRISAENFSRYPSVDVYPLYAVENIISQTPASPLP